MSLVMAGTPANKPAVTRKESWKPTSVMNKGFHTSIPNKAKARRDSPSFSQPFPAAYSPAIAVKPERTTEGDEPVNTTYRGMVQKPIRAAVSLVTPKRRHRAVTAHRKTPTCRPEIARIWVSPKREKFRKRSGSRSSRMPIRSPFI
ncbi:hypothetical protein D3C75_809480 [compost metagenome]